MADKYERCPFCGNDNMTIITREGKDGFRDRHCVVCDYNDGGCGASSGWCRSKEEATWQWNHRTDGWLSINKFPPPNGEYVFVFTTGEEIIKMFRAKSYKTGEYFWSDEFGKYSDDNTVTHWRPMFKEPGEEN